MRTPSGWVGLLVTLAIVVIVLGWLVRRVESRLAFFPFRGEEVTPLAFGVDYQPLNVETADGETLRLWRLSRPDAKAYVVYLHGNGGNLSVWADVLVGVHRQGFDLLAVDYRGYGLSTGSPSEHGLYRDVDAVLQLVAREPRPPGVPLVFWGRSLGTVMAAYAASRSSPDGVILEAGFPSMRAVLETNPVMWALSWASSYRMPTAQWMAGVRAPALVLHGDRDSVIRYSLGRRLFESLPGPKTFVTLAGGEHNVAVPPDEPAYWRAIHAFVAGLGDATSSSARP